MSVDKRLARHQDWVRKTPQVPKRHAADNADFGKSLLDIELDRVSEAGGFWVEPSRNYTKGGGIVKQGAQLAEHSSEFIPTVDF
jgi:hypothetical protein